MFNIKRFAAKFKIVFVIMLFSVAAYFGIFTFVNRSQLHSNPFIRQLDFEYPSYCVTDFNNDMYVIDQSMRRIICLSPDLKEKKPRHNIKYIVEGGSRDEGKFFYAYEIAVNKSGDLFVINGVLDENGFFMDREEILRYSPDGKFKEILYSRKYSKDEQSETIVQRGRLASLSVEGGTLHWFEIEDQCFSENSIDLSSGAYRKMRCVDFPNASLIISGISLSRNNIVYTTRTGDICTISPDGATKVIRNSSEKTGVSSIPWSVASDAKENIYYTDIGARKIFRITPEGLTKTVLSEEIISSAGYVPGSCLHYRCTVGGSTPVIATTNDQNVVIVDPSKGIVSYFAGGRVDGGVVLSRLKYWLALGGAVLIFVIAFYFFYTSMMKKRFPLILKQLLLYIPLIVVSIVAISFMIIDDFSQRYQKEILSKIAQMVQMTQKVADFSPIGGFATNGDYLNDDYKRIRKSLLEAFNYNRDEWNNSYYFVVYRVVDDKLYGFMYLNGQIGVYYPFDYFEDSDSVYRRAYNGEIVTDKSTDGWGNWMYGVGPLYDSKGKIVALVEIGTDLYSFKVQNEKLMKRMARGVVVVSLVFIFVFMMVTYLFLVSIRVLRNAVHRISNGEWHTKVRVYNKNDEISDLSAGFNKMSDYIQNYIEEIVKLNRSYQRFVPEQFLHYLDKDNVIKVQLGDQVQKTMTILFSDIRSFTSLSERMTPKENFDFINSYLSEAGPVVRKNHGFIDKYIGDAIMALFPAAADDAIAAALGITEMLRKFNDQRNEQGEHEINIGFGIHTGSLMLGIIGEHERMEGTVISDNVNLASRLEGITKQFGASIIISEATYESLSDKGKYLHRYLGKIRVKGRKDPVGVFEILDAYGFGLRTLRIKTKDVFEKGISLYQQCRFKEAAARFNKILGYDPDDKSSKLYLAICEELMQQAISAEDWDGAVVLNEK